MADDGASVGRFVVDGSLTIREIETAHSRLRDLLERHSAVEIDCSGAAELDLSAIQLFIAARQSARRAGKEIFLTPASDVLRDVLSQGGFLNTAADRADGAFWSQDKRL